MDFFLLLAPSISQARDLLSGVLFTQPLPQVECEQGQF